MIESYEKALADFNEYMHTSYTTANPELILITRRSGVKKKNEVIERIHSHSKPISSPSAFSHTIAEAIVGMDGDRVSNEAAILFRKDMNYDDDPEAILVHELSHVFALSQEYGGNLFYDIMDEDNLGLFSGYLIWKELIAEYITNKIYPTWPSRLSDFEITTENKLDMIRLDKQDHAVASSYFATVACCEEFCFPDQLEARIEKMHLPFPSTIRLLSQQLKKENYWEITQEFIEEFGNQFIVDKSFVMMDLMIEGALPFPENFQI